MDLEKIKMKADFIRSILVSEGDSNAIAKVDQENPTSDNNLLYMLYIAEKPCKDVSIETRLENLGFVMGAITEKGYILSYSRTTKRK